MTAKVAISEQEYLSLRYEGVEPEYRDGEVIERSMPDYLHSNTQANLAAFFKNRQEELNLFCASEQRMRLYPGRWVVADMAVYHPNRPTERYPSEPPFLVVEILSQDDGMRSVLAKLLEYRRFGVPYVWLVDPESHNLYVMESEFRQVTFLETQEPRLTLTKHDAFDL